MAALPVHDSFFLTSLSFTVTAAVFCLIVALWPMTLVKQKSAGDPTMIGSAFESRVRSPPIVAPQTTPVEDPDATLLMVRFPLMEVPSSIVNEDDPSIVTFPVTV